MGQKDKKYINDRLFIKLYSISGDSDQVREPKLV